MLFTDHLAPPAENSQSTYLAQHERRVERRQVADNLRDRGGGWRELPHRVRDLLQFGELGRAVQTRHVEELCHGADVSIRPELKLVSMCARATKE